jgi:DNA-binding transcriptional MerR regulator
MIRSSFEWILYGLNHKNPLISCFISQKIHLHHKISTQYINKPMNNILASRPALYRIGAVSKLSGVPVPTLRVWQTRYNAFTPATSQGQHRLYDEEDLRKAALLKSLTGQGHGISLIAGLSTTQLQQLLQTGADMALAPAQAPPSSNNPHGTWVLIGQPLAERLQSEHFRSANPMQALLIQAVWADLNEALSSPETASSDVLMVSVNNLNTDIAQQILDLSSRHNARQTVVLYGFGQMKAIDSLGRAGCGVHRDPLNDAELADIVRSTRPPLSDAAWRLPLLNEPVPPRQFSDAVLQRVANIPSQVLCECPRHVAELIGQLGRFEAYSLDCLKQSPKDSELHTELNRMAGTARALFEKALQMVADHEGISLQERP